MYRDTVGRVKISLSFFKVVSTLSNGWPGLDNIYLWQFDKLHLCELHFVNCCWDIYFLLVYYGGRQHYFWQLYVILFNSWQLYHDTCWITWMYRGSWRYSGLIIILLWNKWPLKSLDIIFFFSKICYLFLTFRIDKQKIYSILLIISYTLYYMYTVYLSLF